MPAKKPELQIPLEKIVSHKKGKHGKVFSIKIAHYKPMWVPEQKLSKGASMSYLSGSALPKGAYVVLARSYMNPPEKTKSINSFFSKRGPPPALETPLKKKSRSDEVDSTPEPVKKKKKRVISELLMEGWCGQSRAYIKKFNNILDMKKKSELLNLIQEAMEELKPNKECSHLFSSEKFLTGTIVKHNKQNINCLRAGKTRGEIMCAVCDETFKSSRACRVINHCFNKTHVEKLKKKQANDDKEKGRMEDFTKEGEKEKTITRRVQNFVAQQIALKGLPFSAGRQVGVCIIIRIFRIIYPKFSDNISDFFG